MDAQVGWPEVFVVQHGCAHGCDQLVRADDSELLTEVLDPVHAG
jgi:hypothetical protein